MAVNEMGDTMPSPESPAPTDAPPAPPRRGRTVLIWLSLTVVVAAAVVAGNVGGLRDDLFGSNTLAPKPAAVSGGATGSPDTTAAGSTPLRSQPWWQAVTVLDGVGASNPAPFTIGDGAIQWRVKSSCETGQIVVRMAARPKPVIDASCPAPADTFATLTGTISLQVSADGPWHLVVEQQVDVPLVEPPLPAMTAPGAAEVSTGSFYKIDHPGSGTATVYRLADGTYSLRFADFFVSPNSSLEVRFSALPEPKTSEEFEAAPSAVVATLDVTTGSLNFAVPKDVDPTQYKSVVIWCVQVRSAYAAASLGPVK